MRCTASKRISFNLLLFNSFLASQPEAVMKFASRVLAPITVKYIHLNYWLEVLDEVILGFLRITKTMK